MSRWRAGTRTVVVGLLSVLSLGLVAPPALAATGDVTEFTVPTPTSLQGIAVGSDGALWFAERTANAIGRITTAGVFIEYSLNTFTPGSAPYWMTAGPDKNLWFTERVGNQIGRITTAGVITEFPIPTAGSNPAGITTGPDGALWFTEQKTNKIGRITTAGVITEILLPPHTTSGPFGIAAGPDGNLWFTEFDGSRIGRITTAGVIEITEFALPSGRAPFDITAGGDGNLWFTERGGNAVGRITPIGTITEFPLPTSQANLTGIAADPDGNVWFTEFGGNKVGRITPIGTITEFPLPIPTSQPFAIQPFAIAQGTDGAMWFTEAAGNKIGRIEVPPPDTTPPTVTIASPSGGSAFTVGASPAGGSAFTVGQVVLADYTCLDEAGGSGLLTCDGPVPKGASIDTSLGTHTFTVTATDVAGNQASSSTTYLVVPQPDVAPPSVAITSPQDGSVFTVGQVVLAGFWCTDEVGGSGVSTCKGPVLTGAPIDTSLGTHTFTVTATDVAGNKTTRTSAYAVVGDLGGQLHPSPVWNDAKAGSALTVSFDLGPAAGTVASNQWPKPGKPGGPGNQAPPGLFAAGFPATQAVGCGDPTAAIGPAQTPNVEVHVNKDGRFHLVWKSDKSWAGSCRALVLRLDVPGWRDAPLVFLVSFR